MPDVNITVYRGGVRRRRARDLQPYVLEHPRRLLRVLQPHLIRVLHLLSLSHLSQGHQGEALTVQLQGLGDGRLHIRTQGRLEPQKSIIDLLAEDSQLSRARSGGRDIIKRSRL